MEIVGVECGNVKGDNPPLSSVEQGAKPCEITVRRFFRALHAHLAKAFANAYKPGLLQLVGVIPDGPSQHQRFQIGDVDGMVVTAMAWSATEHNVYVEGRTVAEDTPRKQRGTKEYTRGVFALVVDSDADKGQSWEPTFEPSFTINTSPGNYQYWFLVNQALRREDAEPLGVRLKAETKTDSDTGLPTQPYRVPGLCNYPNQSKRKRGRSPIPAPVELISLDGRRWTADELGGVLPDIKAPEHAAHELRTGRTGRTSAAVNSMFAELGDTHPEGRSGLFMAAVAAAYRKGLSLDDTEEVARKYPNGCASKYLERGDRLREEIERVLKKVVEGSVVLPTSMPPTYPDNSVSLGTGRAQNVEAIRAFLATLDEPPAHCFTVNGGAAITLAPSTWVHTLQASTGIGKTQIAARQIADYVKAARARGERRSFVYPVPTHRLGDEIADKFRRFGMAARVYRGRDAEDPTRPGEKMCGNMAAVNDALAVGADVSKSCCKGKALDGTEVKCVFHDQCGYQNNLRDDSDVWIIPHQTMFHPVEAIKDIAGVFIDESFWRSGVLATDEDTDGEGKTRKAKGLSLDEFSTPTGDIVLDNIRDKLAQALRMNGAGPLRRSSLDAVGLTVGDCETARSTEWKLMEEVPFYPGMPADERKAITTAALRNKRVARFVRRWVALWHAAQALLELDDQGAISGRVFTRDEETEHGTVRIVHTRGVRSVVKQFQAPTLVMDATLPPRPILEAFFPSYRFLAETQVEVRLPEHVKVRQVVDAHVADRKLKVEKHFKEMRRYILKRYIEFGRQPTLVIAQKAHALRLREVLPKGISVEWLNNIAGNDKYGDVRLLIMVGRTMPRPEQVEAIAGALTGVMPQAARIGKDGKPTYNRVIAAIRQHGNVGFAIDVDWHPDQIAEAVRWQICEGEVIQGLGRGRAINRTAGNPLQIDILANLVLPITVGEIASWDEVEVGLEIEMMTDGWFIESSTDMAALWPDVWKDKKSAENWWAGKARDFTLSALVRTYNKGREGEIGPSWQAIEYRPKGRGQQTRKGYYHPSMIADSEAWLTERLGPMAYFAAIASPPQACAREQTVVAQDQDAPLPPIPPWWKDGRPSPPLMPSPPPWPGGPEHVPVIPPPNLGSPPWATPR